MSRSTKLIAVAVAIAAAAIAPVAGAHTLPYPGVAPAHPVHTRVARAVTTLITDNSPSQNRIATRHAKPTRKLAAYVPPCGWVVYTDDQGVPWLAPGGNCPERTTAAAGATQPGWTTVLDDLGVPWLVPIG